MRAKLLIPAVAITLAALHSVQGQSSTPVPVTVDNFIRAESDLYFSNIAKDGGFGKFVHRREPAAIKNQTVLHLNRDTLYFAIVLDLDDGPATITPPEAGARFMSLIIVNEDHSVRAPSNSAALRTAHRTICQSLPAGTTPSAFIVHEKKSSMAPGNSRSLRPRDDSYLSDQRNKPQSL